jgi:hypothetical protein
MPDMAFMIFQIANKKQFLIQHFRFIDYFTQSFLVLGSWFGIPLKWLALVYSTSFPIFFFACFLLIMVVYKNYKIGLLFILFHFVLPTHCIFWPLHEIFQGVSVLILFFAFYEYRAQEKNLNLSFWMLTIGCFILIIFSHPLVIIPVAYLFVWTALTHKKWSRSDMMIILLILCIYFAKHCFFTNGYEKTAMESLDNLKWHFPKYYHLYSFKLFYQYVAHQYYWLIPGYFAAVFMLLKNHKWLKFIVFNIFFFGLITLINVCYKNGAEQFYLESQYSILGLIMGVPLVYDVFPKWNNRIVLSVLALIIFSFMIRIYCISDMYHSRIAWYRSLIDRREKMIISSENAPMNTLKMIWCSAFEVWLLSTIEHGESSSVLIHDNQFFDSKPRKDVFISNWEVFPYANLDSHYFKFKDTTRYRKYQFETVAKRF